MFGLTILELSTLFIAIISGVGMPLYFNKQKYKREQEKEYRQKKEKSKDKAHKELMLQLKGITGNIKENKDNINRNTQEIKILQTEVKQINKQL
jgi:uncharacterized protein HemX